MWICFFLFFLLLLLLHFITVHFSSVCEFVVCVHARVFVCVCVRAYDCEDVRMASLVYRACVRTHIFVCCILHVRRYVVSVHRIESLVKFTITKILCMYVDRRRRQQAIHFTRIDVMVQAKHTHAGHRECKRNGDKKHRKNYYYFSCGKLARYENACGLWMDGRKK